MKGVLLAGMVLCAAAPARSLGPDAGWKGYFNERFGYSVCYPPELVPQPEAGNGDGREFKSRDGKSVARVYGGYEQPADGGKAPFSVELGYALDYSKTKGVVVGYKVVKPHFFALSGSSPAGLVWYRQTIEVQDRAVSLEFEYPVGAKAAMDPVVTKMAGCFAVGKMEY